MHLLPACRWLRQHTDQSPLMIAECGLPIHQWRRLWGPALGQLSKSHCCLRACRWWRQRTGWGSAHRQPSCLGTWTAQPPGHATSLRCGTCRPAQGASQSLCRCPLCTWRRLCTSKVMPAPSASSAESVALPYMHMKDRTVFSKGEGSALRRPPSQFVLLLLVHHNAPVPPR